VEVEKETLRKDRKEDKMVFFGAQCIDDDSDEGKAL
jgi:hypothetical protein